MLITKLEKSELSIHLADKMDKMDRNWEWFKNSFIRIFVRKVRYLSGRVTNGKVRFVIRMSRRILYYFVILTSAFLLTRDDLTHVWLLSLDWRDTNMEVNEFSKHLMEYIVLFLIMIIYSTIPPKVKRVIIVLKSL